MKTEIKYFLKTVLLKDNMKILSNDGKICEVYFPDMDLYLRFERNGDKSYIRIE